jgi:hypothetical protein
VICPYAKNCRIDLTTPAELFLHQQLHNEPWHEFGANAGNLNGLPYILLPRIARLMEDYRQARLPEGNLS